MSARGNEIEGRDAELLYAYHDGECGRLSRWWFERRLARSPALARELELLRTMGSLLVEHDAGAETPDLWDRIALRLPAVEARREAAEAESAASWIGAWWRPIGAAAAAVAVAAIAFDTQLPSGGSDTSVVRWIDSGGRSVIVLDDDADMTVIWVLDGDTDAASRGDRHAFS